MVLDPRTPVVVGAAAVAQRFDDPREAVEASALIVRACEGAAADAGTSRLLREAGLLLVPRGTAAYRDPAGLVAGRLGNAGAHTVVAELGVLQTTLIARAADAINSGQVEVAIVCGGEAKWRQLRATITGMTALDTDDAGSNPTEVLRPDGMIISAGERDARLVTAVSQYAMIENARRFADRQSVGDHRRTVAELWAGFSTVAQRNPAAWHREPMTADDIATPGPRNRALAFPYNKWHNSQWNVDQAASLILCSAAKAASLGIPSDRWVFAHAIAESNHMVPLSERTLIHRSPGFSVAAARGCELAGTNVGEIAHLDLYSCFPIAVRTQMMEMGIAAGRQLTVTGGMTFGGGPLNNYVLQALAAMVPLLREDSRSTGLITAVSGLMTKQGVTIWGSQPSSVGYRYTDVSREVAAATTRSPVAEAAAGPATVATYTVESRQDEGPRTVVIAVRHDGSRSIATADAEEIARAATQDEFCGRSLQLDGSGGFTVE